MRTRLPPYSRSAFSLTELLIVLLVSAALMIGVLRLSKHIVRQSKQSLQTSTQEQELIRFRSLMLTDLARAGNDASGLGVLKAKQFFGGASCVQQTFEYGLVSYPTDESCNKVLGSLGILSYQGLDENKNGVFFPEESVDFSNPKLRPHHQGVGQTPTTSHFYNDYIVYDYDPESKVILRRNVGSPALPGKMVSETVLRNVASFHVRFKQDFNLISDPGTNYVGVTIVLILLASGEDPNYTNPNLSPNSPWTHYKTLEMNFSYDVIVTALCVY